MPAYALQLSSGIFKWSFMFQMIYVALSFRVTSLALGANEVTLKDAGKISPYLNTTKHNKA